MRVLAVVREIEPTALEHQARAAGYAARGYRAALRARELTLGVADLAEKVFKIVPSRATIVVGRHSESAGM